MRHWSPRWSATPARLPWSALPVTRARPPTRCRLPYWRWVTASPP